MQTHTKRFIPSSSAKKKISFLQDSSYVANKNKNEQIVQPSSFPWGNCNCRIISRRWTRVRFVEQLTYTSTQKKQVSKEANLLQRNGKAVFFSMHLQMCLENVCTLRAIRATIARKFTHTYVHRSVCLHIAQVSWSVGAFTALLHLLQHLFDLLFIEFHPSFSWTCKQHHSFARVHPLEKICDNGEAKTQTV